MTIAPNDPKTEITAPRALTLDLEKYQPYLDDPNLSEDQKRAFLEALWTIITAFVDLGYGIHPVQQTLEETCGQNRSGAHQCADRFRSVVGSDAHKQAGGLS